MNKYLAITLMVFTANSNAASVTCWDMGGMTSCSNGVSAMNFGGGITTYNVPTPSYGYGSQPTPMIMPIQPIAPLPPMQPIQPMQPMQPMRPWSNPRY